MIPMLFKLFQISEIDWLKFPNKLYVNGLNLIAKFDQYSKKYHHKVIILMNIDAKIINKISKFNLAVYQSNMSSYQIGFVP